MVFDNGDITDFDQLSEAQEQELQEEFISGECWLLALTLNIMYGYPICLNIDDEGHLEHAWSRLPNGKALDIDGISAQSGPWFTPSHSDLDVNAFLALWRDETPEGPGLTVSDLRQVERCKKVVTQYLLPKHRFTETHLI